MAENFDRTAVNYDTVTTAATDVRNTGRSIDEGLESLMREVARVAETWDGEARTAYHEIQRQSETEMNAMVHKLQRIARLLDESVVGYSDTDKGNAARFRMLS
ncbi:MULTISPECIES: WXG100 family type VII secretion target [unclassified Streptomyces]|uniref:WXG100 family type VII secretion target n=1 Tax=unclassified Streptomyces TaxID=2593676 RepID=UPI0022863560|nr:WXG100 family type VII secretion target [Streptomyces sp. Je 1-369]WAL98213.1 WXG100 family type VII secretion target [Streptomyces sp. Je 1-369]